MKTLELGRLDSSSGARWNFWGGVVCSLLLTFTVVAVNAAQIRWDGEAGDGNWQSPANWQGNQLPGSEDEILLDNSLVGVDYSISLGAINSTVSIKSLRISPATGRQIRLIIPADNTASPALVCTQGGYSLQLENGSVFQNSSGASSGNILAISDSLRINNGGKYIHNTARSHADLVRINSRAPGTETGEFEFNVPVASSTISVSGQVFGKLTLAAGNGVSINYTGTGTNNLRVRSDLEIRQGVNLNFNLEGRVDIGGNILHRGNQLNLGNTARTLTMWLGGNLETSAGSLITESGTGKQSVRFSGTVLQQLDLQGAITNDIEFVTDNEAGIQLTRDLRLDHELNLTRGKIMTGNNVLVLGPACKLVLAANGSGGQAAASYIDGKLKKEGLVGEDFQFPVGKNGIVRWVGLKNATGNFLVEYIKSDPRIVSPQVGTGLAHISSMEYWSVRAEPGSGGVAPAAGPELSFDNVNSGLVTDLSHLRVARLNGGIWQNGGNASTSGTAGSSGSVIGSSFSGWSLDHADLFSLASSNAAQNALPLIWKSFSAYRHSNGVMLRWSANDTRTIYYRLESSADQREYKTLGNVPANGEEGDYQFLHERMGKSLAYYRVILVRDDSSSSMSSTVRVQLPVEVNEDWQLIPVPGGVQVIGRRPFPAGTFITVTDLQGRKVGSMKVVAESNTVFIPLQPGYAGPLALVVRIIPIGKIPISNIVLVR